VVTNDVRGRSPSVEKGERSETSEWELSKFACLRTRERIGSSACQKGLRLMWERMAAYSGQLKTDGD
jgi:hypothetical protein